VPQLPEQAGGGEAAERSPDDPYVQLIHRR
jgi:hypothetical protein